MRYAIVFLLGCAIDETTQTPQVSSMTADSLIIYAGQSNVIGTLGNTNTLDPGLLLTAPFPAVRLHTQVALIDDSPIPWTIVPTQDLQPWAAPTINMGSELTFGRYYYRTGGSAGGTPWIGKMCIGGSTISEWSVGSGYPTGGTELFTQFANYIDARVTESGQSLAAIIWIQGESDAKTTATANAYAAKLAAFVAALRGRYGSTFFFIISRLNTALGNGSTPTNIATVQAAQAAYVAANPGNSLLIDEDDLALGGDSTHYPTDSLCVMGIRHAEVLAAAIHPGRTTDSGSSGITPWIQGDDMPIVTSSGADVTPWLPIYKTGDIVVVVASNSVTNTAPSLSTANGFAQVGSAIVSNNAGATFQTLAVFTKTATSDYAGGSLTGIAPVVSVGAGNIHLAAIAFVVRGSSGVDGTPSTGANNASNTTISVAGPTTTAANTLVVSIIAGHTATTVSASSMADATLSGFSEIRDSNKLAGTKGQAILLCTGTKDTAGATGTVTGAYSANTTWAAMTIAFAPSAGTRTGTVSGTSTATAGASSSGPQTASDVTGRIGTAIDSQPGSPPQWFDYMRTLGLR